MEHALTSEERLSLAQRLEEAEKSLNNGRGVGLVKVIASLIGIGDIEDAKEMCLTDWDKLAGLPVVGELLAKELIPEEIRQFTRFRIKLQKE